ncbi:MAG TPA: NAD-dependent epimerase/dehydratase family protein [Candidatus Bilamarchaeum sp.]|nr:NAD-dependent epimerase/dehydratase family protein [Candidatus Bilamarchaeum sp.]
MAGKVYVTGAGGRLASAVLSKVNAVPLVRRASGLKGEIVTDFSVDQLRSILGDARAVIHLAGSIDARDSKTIHESNVGLTWRIVNAVPEGCKVVFSSSISVYGKKLAKKPADENTKTAPDTDYARTKLEAEGVVRKQKQHVILRIGTLYGPQFEDYFMIFDRLKAGKMRVVGDGKNRIPFVHADDVAAVIASALEKGQGTYVVAGEPLSQMEIYSVACKELGVEPPKKSIPLAFAGLAAGIWEGASRAVGKKPRMTREHVAVLGNDRIFDCTKAKSELGFAPRPLADGIREMAAEYRKRASGNVKNTNI